MEKQYNNSGGLVSAGLIQRLDSYLIATSQALVPDITSKRSIDLGMATHFLYLLVRELSPMIDKRELTKLMEELDGLRAEVSKVEDDLKQQRRGASIPFSLMDKMYAFDMELRKIIFRMGLYMAVSTEGGVNE